MMAYCQTSLPAQHIIIMYGNKIIMAILLLVFCFNISLAQKRVKEPRLPKRKPSFVLQAGGGMSNYSAGVNLSSVAYPGTLKKLNPAGTVRLMWYPRYRLRLGIESGFTNFYKYKVKDTSEGKVRLQAIPVMVVWSMQIVPRVNVYGGLGSYFLTTKLNYKGAVNSRDWVLGSNIAVSYTQPVSKRLGIAAEAKWMNAFETKDAALSLQLYFSWKVFQWN